MSRSTGCTDSVRLPKARIGPGKADYGIHAGLFVLTLVTMTILGANLQLGADRALLPFVPASDLVKFAFWKSGLRFSLPLMAILLGHEMGHYLTARRYGIETSLPYFLPLPLMIGTLGAFIRIRTPFRSKRELFDVGVGGPIAGFLIAVPILFLGLSSPASAGNIPPGSLVLGDSLLSYFATLVIPGSPRYLITTACHPFVLAAVFGLFVTALNLIPLGQLDGGHALEAVSSRARRRISIPVAVGLIILGAWTTQLVWMLWGILGVTMLRRHPAVPDEAVPLDFKRKAVAWGVLLILIVSFAPIPIYEMGP